jgi:hypothetical protein
MGWDGVDRIPARSIHTLLKNGIFLLIPNPHHGEDVSVDLIKKVLARAGINREEWLEIS